MWDFINKLKAEKDLLLQCWDEAVVLGALVLARKPRRILEIGTRRGGSALVMAEALAQLQVQGLIAEAQIDCVDETQEWTIPDGCDHLMGLVNRIMKHSPEGVPEGQQYDLIHIDGNHNQEPCLVDLQTAFRHSHADTMIVCHDANYPGVRGALEAFAISHASAHVIYNFTKREDRQDDWGGQALIIFKE